MPAERIFISAPRGPVYDGYASQAVVEAIIWTNMMGRLRGYADPVGEAFVNSWQIVQKFLETDADALFCVDPDMVFPREAAIRLADHDKDIVGVTTPYKDWRGLMAMGMELDETPMGKVGRKMPLRRVNLLPGGCMMISRRVIEALEKPIWRREAIGPSERSPDYVFCRAAREAGFEIWLDPVLSCDVGHMGLFKYTLPDASAEVESGETVNG